MATFGLTAVVRRFVAFQQPFSLCLSAFSTNAIDQAIPHWNRRRLSGSEVSIYLGSSYPRLFYGTSQSSSLRINKLTCGLAVSSFIFRLLFLQFLYFFLSILSFSFFFIYLCCSSLLCFCLFLPHSPFPPFILSSSIAFYILSSRRLVAVTSMPCHFVQFFHTPTPTSARSYACRAADPCERLTEAPWPFISRTAIWDTSPSPKQIALPLS